MVVIHGENTDVSTVDEKVLTFEFGDDCIKKWNGNSNGQPFSYEGAVENTDANARINDFIGIASTGNILQLRINEVYVNNLDQTGASNYSLTTSNLNLYHSSTKTLGIPNSIENEDFINSLALQQILQIECEKTSSNSVAITIDPGSSQLTQTIGDESFSGPYTLNTPSYNEFGIESNSVSAFGLECGKNELVITDVLGREDNCFVTVGMESEIRILNCNFSEVDLKSLLCDNIESECIYIKLGSNTSDNLSSFQEIPEIVPEYDEYPVIIKFSDNFGNIIYEAQIIIDVILTGESCDDNDSCTEDDKYDESCSCKGKSTIPDIDLIIEDAAPCANSIVGFSLADIYDSYVWYLDGYEMSREESFSTTLIGKVEVEVKKEGCILSEAYNILDVNEPNIEISASSNFICNSNKPVTLTISADLAGDCVWENEFGETIATNINMVEVSNEGIYRVTIQECKLKGEIFISGVNSENYQVFPKAQIICQGGTADLDITPVPAPDYTIEWSNGLSSSSIEVSLIGDYSVTITSTTGCEYVDQVSVIASDDIEKIGQTFIDSGFLLQEYQLPSGNLTSGWSLSRGVCEYENLSGVDIELVPFGQGQASTLELEVQKILDLGCEKCDFSTGAYIDVYECSAESYDFATLFNLGESVDGYIKAVAIRDIVNNRLNVYYKITYNPVPYCINLDEDRSSLGKDIVVDILCALKNGDSDMELNYQAPNSLFSFVCSEVTLLPPNLLIDNTISPVLNTIKIANFQKGKTIKIPKLNELAPIRVTKYCINTITNNQSVPFPLSEPEEVTGDFWQYSFDYCDAGEYVPQSLLVYVDDIEKESFHRILTELTRSDESLHTILDIEGVNDFIVQNGQFNVPQYLPNCLFDDELLCDLIEELIAPTVLSSNAVIEERANGLASLLRTNSIDDALKIKGCIDNEVDNTYLIDDIQEEFGYDDAIFTELVSLFYTMGVNGDISNAVVNDEIFAIHSGIGITLNSPITKDRFTQVDYTFYPAFLKIYLGVEYTIQDNFHHYQPYYVDVSHLNIPLTDSRGFKLGSIGMVPGIYIPYLLDGATSESNKETLILAAVIAGTVFSIADVAIIYRAGQLSSLKGAFGVLDVSVGVAELMTSIEPFCEGLGPWCDDWKEISKELAIFSITGRVVSSQVLKVRSLKERWKNKIKAEVQNRPQGAAIAQIVDDFFDGVITNLKARLVEKYPTVPIPIIDDIVTKFPQKGFQLVTDEIAAQINLTANNGGDFLSDLINTAGVQGKIGNHLHELTTEVVKAWKGLYNSGLAKDFTWLRRASKWIEKDAEIISVTSSSNVIVKKNGEEIAKIIDGELQPIKYLSGGSRIDDAGSGYDFYILSNGEIGFQARLVPDFEFGQATVRLENSTIVGTGGIGPGGLLETEIETVVGGLKIAKGENVFNEIFDQAASNGEVLGIRGLWNDALPDNLNTFNNLIINQVNPGNITIEEAALQTFTGNMAIKKKFNTVSNIFGIQNADNTYVQVTVEFTK